MSALTLHSNLAVLKVKDIVKLQVLKLTHSYRLNRLPSIFDDYFSVNSDIHAYDTRQVHKYAPEGGSTPAPACLIHLMRLTDSHRVPTAVSPVSPCEHN